MTIEEFDNIGFTAKSQAVYKGDRYDIACVNFEEKLIGFEDIIDKVFDEEEEEEEELAVINWVRCENCKMI